jgi:hypothetical protein
LYECEQIIVQAVLVRDRQAVRRCVVDLEQTDAAVFTPDGDLVGSMDNTSRGVRRSHRFTSSYSTSG